MKRATIVIQRGDRDPIVIKGLTAFAVIGIALLAPVVFALAVGQCVALAVHAIRVAVGSA